MKDFANNKKKMLGLLIFGIVMVVMGVSYAWFNYYKSGTNNKVIMGNVYLTMEEGQEEISISSVFPMTKEEARARNDNVMTFTIEGLNSTDKDLYYEINLKYGDELESPYERFRDIDLVFDLIEIDNNNEETFLVDAGSYDDINGRRIYSETIEHETNTASQKRYKLRMWINDKTVLISDSDPNRTYPATGPHAYKNHYASVKVAVYGDFKEKDSIIVRFDSNGGDKLTGVKTYKPNDTFGTLPVPVRNGYRFVGWEDSIHNIITSSDVVPARYLISETKTPTMYKCIGDYEFDGISDYIDTGIYIFNSSNWQKNFYMEFTITKDNCPGKNATTSDDSAGGTSRATIMSAKNEGGSPWAGIDFRHQENRSRYYGKATVNNSSAGTAAGSAKEITPSWSDSPINVKMIRIGTKIYYILNNGTLTEWNDYTGFNKQFNVPVTFGAGYTGENGSIQRRFTGILSNLLVEFISDAATISDYTDYIHNDFTIIKKIYNDVNLTAKWEVDTMNTFPEFITNNKENIKKIYFKKENESDLARYNAISDTTLKGDIATVGSVKAWLEQDNQDNLYTLYVESETVTHLTTGVNLFNGYTNLIEIDLSNVDTSNVTDMHAMFYYCDNLTSLNLSNFNTSNVATMNRMFEGCSGLVSLDLSSFDTSNVTRMDSMFRECSSLTSLDLSNFDTSNVTQMPSMFNRCKSLIALDVSNFNTSNVTNMDSMFESCRELTSLNLSNFNTSNVTNMLEIFFQCFKLERIYVSNLWTVENVTNSDNMFYGCTSLVGQTPNTTYAFSNSNPKDKTYAVIATDSTPGYLTDISLKPSS